MSDVNETGGGGTSGSPIRLEAEEADTLLNYHTENIGVASGNQVLSFRGNQGNESGGATFAFNEAAGTFDIIVGTFDENGGVASFVVTLNDGETGTTTDLGALSLTDDRGSNLANAQTAVSLPVAFGVTLTPGDSLTVWDFEEGAEHARLDYIELVPVV